MPAPTFTIPTTTATTSKARGEMDIPFISIPIVETTDEVIHCETNLPSDEVRTSLTWRINAVSGALIQPDFHLNVQLKVYKKIGGKLYGGG